MLPPADSDVGVDAAAGRLGRVGIELPPADSELACALML